MEDRTTFISKAVSDGSGTVTFKRDRYSLATGTISDSSENTLGHRMCDKPSEEIQVETTSLDDFYKETGLQPDLVKIDVEGAEIQVIRGMKKLLSEAQPCVILDGHKAGTMQLLLDHGYQVYTIDNEDGIPRLQEAPYPFTVVAAPPPRMDDMIAEYQESKTV